MSAIVDFAYYRDDYKGTEVDQTSFPALCAHASRMVGSMARWQVTEENFSSFPSIVQTLYKLAICSQIDFIAENGLESITGGAGNDTGFTVGKVTVHSGGNGTTKGGTMSANICPVTVMYLEQTGLMHPGMVVVNA